MKNNHIKIIKNSKRNINYESLLNLYDYDIETPLTLKVSEVSNQLVLLDMATPQESIQLMNKIRLGQPFAPFLIIVDPQLKQDVHYMIREMEGLGRLEIVYDYEEESFSLLRAIEVLLNPNLPIKREELAIVIPVYDEASRIAHVKNFLQKLEHLVYDGDYGMTIYLINDGSKDNTKELCDAYIDQEIGHTDTLWYKSPLVLRDLGANSAKAGTYIEAFQKIDADYIVTVDADDAFELRDIIRMIHLIKVGYYDMIIASKDKDDNDRKLFRHILSLGKRLLTKPFLPKGVTDSQTGLKVFKKEMIRQMLPYLNKEYGLAIDLEMLYLAKKMRYRVKQVGVHIIDREGSHIDVIKDTLRFLKAMVKMLYKQDYGKMV